MANSQNRIQLKVGDRTLTATLADNDATRELAEFLAGNTITIEMEDYGGFEKVGELPKSFSTSNSQITTVAGDIMLYQGNKMVIFYGSNSWSYTPLGKIEGASAEYIKEFLGTGNVTVTVSLCSESGIDNVVDHREKMTVYKLDGQVVRERPLHSGIYIIDGRKVMISD